MSGGRSRYPFQARGKPATNPEQNKFWVFDSHVYKHCHLLTPETTFDEPEPQVQRQTRLSSGSFVPPFVLIATQFLCHLCICERIVCTFKKIALHWHSYFSERSFWTLIFFSRLYFLLSCFCQLFAKSSLRSGIILFVLPWSGISVDENQVSNAFLLHGCFATGQPVHEV